MIGKPFYFFNKDQSHIRQLFASLQNSLYKTQENLGDEVLKLTDTTICDHDKKWIGIMAKWSIITEKARLSESLRETTVSISSASE